MRAPPDVEKHTKGLFVLMASILEKAGVAEDLFDAMQIFAGKLRGGVAIQTIVVAVVLLCFLRFFP